MSGQDLESKDRRSAGGRLSHLPLFIDDYEAATPHLTLEEDGAYNRLLRLCWRQSDCSIPADDAWIMRRMRCDETTYARVVKPILVEFFTRSRSRWFQKRLREEHAYVSAVSDARKAAGRKGGRAKALKNNGIGPSKARNLPEQNASSALAPTPTPTPIKESPLPPKGEPERFDEFWSVYPHRGGTKKGKAPAQKSYQRAIAKGVSEQTIVDGAKAAHRHPDVQRGFSRDPATWLNQQGWQDEIGSGGPPGSPPGGGEWTSMGFIPEGAH